jgi:hypothetical protein
MAALLFWKILLAHAATDFLLQPEWVAENKRRPAILLFHVGIFFALACLLVFAVPPAAPGRVAGWLLALTAYHAALDWSKAFLQERLAAREVTGRWETRLFVADQALHLAAILLVAGLADRQFTALLLDGARAHLANPKVYAVASFAVLIVVGGAYLTHFVCRKFLVQRDLQPGRGNLRGGGFYIGILERSLVMAAVLLGRYEFIGFLFAAKSVARFPEMRDGHLFAEYFLVGTLTSLSIAIFGSLLLKWLIG